MGATYRWDGQQIHVPSEQLLTASQPIRIMPSLSLEQLPNRNSLPYAKLYEIEHAHSVYRGTLRYAGWCGIMQSFREFGLLDQATSELPATWGDLAAKLAIGPGAAAATPEALDCLQWLGVFSDTEVAQKG